MGGFWTRLVTLFAVVMILFGYNNVLEAREKDEQIAKLSAQLADSEEAGSEQLMEYTDGTYSGKAQGFGGEVSVQVLVKEQKITEINILSADGEDGAYLTMAKDVIPAMLEAQSADVDTVSGATFSSMAIRDAAKQALEEAVK